MRPVDSKSTFIVSARVQPELAEAFKLVADREDRSSPMSCDE